MASVQTLNSSVLKEFEEVAYAKVVLMGSVDVGKTSLIMRFCQEKFKHKTTSTIHVDFATVKVSLPDTRKPIVLQLWDTVGQERFSAMNISFLRRAVAAIIVYDVTDKESFQKITRFVQDIEYTIPEALVVMVANKDDKQERDVTTKEGQALAKGYGFEYIETSALTGHNVDNLFHNIVRSLSKKNELRKEESIKLNRSTTNKKKSCCRS